MNANPQQQKVRTPTIPRTIHNGLLARQPVGEGLVTLGAAQASGVALHVPDEAGEVVGDPPEGELQLAGETGMVSRSSRVVGWSSGIDRGSAGFTPPETFDGASGMLRTSAMAASNDSRVVAAGKRVPQLGQ